jgi:tRNA modification GTPase
VIDLIRARSDLALRSAREQLAGRLGREIAALRDELVSLRAHVEASIDFADEDIAPDEGERLTARLDVVQQKLSALIATAERGRILREGVRVVIYGPTNAGKSSLLNRLLRYDRAIVNPAPGTTRDTVEEAVNMRGIPLRLFDTAGLRETSDDVEREGMARTEQSLEIADLSLHLADASASRPPSFNVSSNGTDMLILNKSDLPEHTDWQAIPAARISCLTGEGIENLEEQILARLGLTKTEPESVLAINARHRDCLRRALDACQRATTALRGGLTPDCYAVDLKVALEAVGEVVGEVDHEQVLDSVFGQFCIGK